MHHASPGGKEVGDGGEVREGGARLPELVDVVLPREKRGASEELSQDARQAPHVHGGAVAGGAEEHLRRSVPPASGGWVISG